VDLYSLTRYLNQTLSGLLVCCGESFSAQLCQLSLSQFFHLFGVMSLLLLVIRLLLSLESLKMKKILSLIYLLQLLLVSSAVFLELCSLQ